jgi:Uma2 family endonuclease
MAAVSPQPADPLFSGIIFHPEDESSPFVVPPTAATWQGFREWARSEEFPERGNLSFANGEIHIDMSPERFDTHNLLRTEISRVLANLLHENPFGLLCNDRILFSNSDANLSTEPDAMFVRRETIRSGRAEFASLSARPQDTKELLGSPDWVLEIVSPSSIEKDNQVLRESYFRAGVHEYWLIDALGAEIDFQLLVRGETGYSPVEPQDGWLPSPTFGKQFKLEREKDEDGFWLYTLHMQ